MTDLDKALERLWQEADRPDARAAFYDLFLNTTFYVPTTESNAPDGGCSEKHGTAPLVVVYEGEDYLVLFDREERLNGWAEQILPFAEVPGHILVGLCVPGLHWALNVGTEHAKQFVPDEIAWLRRVVSQAGSEGPRGADENNFSARRAESAGKP